jgi:class 3 adenylate cyclase
VSHVTRELFFLISSEHHSQSPIELRIGINLGDVIVDDDEV